MKRIYILVSILVFSTLFAFGQQIRKAEKGIFLLKNATLHTISSGVYKGDILLKDGIIAEIGTLIRNVQNATTIDCTGKHKPE